MAAKSKKATSRARGGAPAKQGPAKTAGRAGLASIDPQFASRLVVHVGREGIQAWVYGEIDLSDLTDDEALSNIGWSWTQLSGLGGDFNNAAPGNHWCGAQCVPADLAEQCNGKTVGYVIDYLYIVVQRACGCA